MQGHFTALKGGGDVEYKWMWEGNAPIRNEHSLKTLKEQLIKMKMPM